MLTNEEKYIELLSSVDREGIDELLDWLDQSDFYSAPASSRFHGSYPGGLLDHSLNVYEELKRVLAAYPEIECSDESAIICALLHDLCKVNFYIAEKRNRKNEFGQWESYDSYRIEEKFCYGGHGSKSVFLAERFIKLTIPEAVAINCHMGAFDNEYVGKSYEQYPMAWALNVADQAASYLRESKGGN